MKNILLAAALSALLAISGTAIGLGVVRAESQPSAAQTLAANSGYSADANYNGNQPGRGGCAGGCGTRRSGCAVGGSGGCRGGAQASGTQAPGAQDDSSRIEAIRQSVSEYYASATGETDFSVEVKDFGCHQEAYVLKGGAKVAGFSVSGNSITEFDIQGQ